MSSLRLALKLSMELLNEPAKDKDKDKESCRAKERGASGPKDKDAKDEPGHPNSSRSRPVGESSGHNSRTDAANTKKSSNPRAKSPSFARDYAADSNGERNTGVSIKQHGVPKPRSKVSASSNHDNQTLKRPHPSNSAIKDSRPSNSGPSQRLPALSREEGPPNKLARKESPETISPRSLQREHNHTHALSTPHDIGRHSSSTTEVGSMLPKFQAQPRENIPSSSTSPSLVYSRKSSAASSFSSNTSSSLSPRPSVPKTHTGISDAGTKRLHVNEQHDRNLPKVQPPCDTILKESSPIQSNDSAEPQSKQATTDLSSLDQSLTHSSILNTEPPPSQFESQSIPQVLDSASSNNGVSESNQAGGTFPPRTAIPEDCGECPIEIFQSSSEQQLLSEEIFPLKDEQAVEPGGLDRSDMESPTGRLDRSPLTQDGDPPSVENANDSQVSGCELPTHKQEVLSPADNDADQFEQFTSPAVLDLGCGDGCTRSTDERTHEEKPQVDTVISGSLNVEGTCEQVERLKPAMAGFVKHVDHIVTQADEPHGSEDSDIDAALREAVPRAASTASLRIQLPQTITESSEADSLPTPATDPTEVGIGILQKIEEGSEEEDMSYDSSDQKNVENSVETKTSTRGRGRGRRQGGRGRRGRGRRSLHDEDMSVEANSARTARSAAIVAKLKLASRTPRGTFVEDAVRVRSPKPQAGDAALTLVRSSSTTDNTIHQGASKVVQSEDIWVCCDKCAKWRRIPMHITLSSLPEKWFCSMNHWDPERQSCDAKEETYPDPAAAHKPDAFATNTETVAKELPQITKEDLGLTQTETPSTQASPRSSIVGLNYPIGHKDPKVDNQDVQSSVNKGQISTARSSDDKDVNEKRESTSNRPCKRKRNLSLSGDAEDDGETIESSAKTNVPASNIESHSRRGRPPASATSVPTDISVNLFNTQPVIENINWVMCNKCKKWRKVPKELDVESLVNEDWFCSMNTWDPIRANCDAVEEAEVEPIPALKTMDTTVRAPRGGHRRSRGGHSHAHNTMTAVSTTVIDATTGQPVQKVVRDWVQCERRYCKKWRRLPPGMDPGQLPEKWFCEMNTWDADKASCDAPEDSDSDPQGGGPRSARRGIHLILKDAKGPGALSYRRLIFGADGKIRAAFSERNPNSYGLFSYTETYKPTETNDEYVEPTRRVGYWWSCMYDHDKGVGDTSRRGGRADRGRGGSGSGRGRKGRGGRKKGSGNGKKRNRPSDDAEEDDEEEEDNEDADEADADGGAEGRVPKSESDGDADNAIVKETTDYEKRNLGNLPRSAAAIQRELEEVVNVESTLTSVHADENKADDHQSDLVSPCGVASTELESTVEPGNGVSATHQISFPIAETPALIAATDLSKVSVTPNQHPEVFVSSTREPTVLAVANQEPSNPVSTTSSHRDLQFQISSSSSTSSSSWTSSLPAAYAYDLIHASQRAAGWHNRTQPILAKRKGPLAPILSEPFLRRQRMQRGIVESLLERTCVDSGTSYSTSQPHDSSRDVSRDEGPDTCAGREGLTQQQLLQEELFQLHFLDKRFESCKRGLHLEPQLFRAYVRELELAGRAEVTYTSSGEILIRGHTFPNSSEETLAAGTGPVKLRKAKHRAV